MTVLKFNKLGTFLTEKSIKRKLNYSFNLLLSIISIK